MHLRHQTPDASGTCSTIYKECFLLQESRSVVIFFPAMSSGMKALPLLTLLVSLLAMLAMGEEQGEEGGLARLAREEGHGKSGHMAKRKGKAKQNNNMKGGQRIVKRKGEGKGIVKAHGGRSRSRTNKTRKSKGKGNAIGRGNGKGKDRKVGKKGKGKGRGTKVGKKGKGKGRKVGKKERGKDRGRKIGKKGKGRGRKVGKKGKGNGRMGKGRGRGRKVSGKGKGKSKDKGTKVGQKANGKGKGRGRKVGNKSGMLTAVRQVCTVNEPCVANIASYTKDLKRIGDYMRQESRINRTVRIATNKNVKKDLFVGVWSRIVSAGGGNSSNLTCSGSSTSSGALQLKNLTATLNNCSVAINISCNSASFPLPNKTNVRKDYCWDAESTSRAQPGFYKTRIVLSCSFFLSFFSLPFFFSFPQPQ